MRYSTSPPVSRCHSPLLSECGSSLPPPVTYRQNCIGAATKLYKYLRKLLKFQQMDFEFALWQIMYLFVAPQKVYRNFQNRKQTKLQFARDDPAFLVLLACWLFVFSIVWSVLHRLNFLHFLKFLIYISFVDCIAVGIVIATLFWFVTNRYFKVDKTQNIEWGYAFDIHLNAFFPPLIILQIVAVVLYSMVYSAFSMQAMHAFHVTFFVNTMWYIAVCYYVYITFLGYTSTEILRSTHLILLAIPMCFPIYIYSIIAQINLTFVVASVYSSQVGLN